MTYHDTPEAARARLVAKVLRTRYEQAGAFEDAQALKDAMYAEFRKPEWRAEFDLTPALLNQAIATVTEEVLRKRVAARRRHAVLPPPLIALRVRPILAPPPQGPPPLSHAEAKATLGDLNVPTDGGRFGGERSAIQQGPGRPEFFPDLVLWSD